MHRILLVEDTPECQILVTRALVNMEIQLTTAGTVNEALAILKDAGDSAFDLIMLDLGLPDGEGFAVLEYLHSNSGDQEQAIFLLTGNNELSSKVAAFNLGAEDYLVKPVNPIELRARIEMRLRKIVSRKKTSRDCKRGILTLKPSLMKVSLQRQDKEFELELTNKEFKILYCLAYQDQRVFSRSDLVKEVWGAGVHVLERTVDSHICAIRRKLGESFIECVPAVGYRFTYPEKLRKSC